ncbi:hypothetical protein VP01_76g13 [Puccinia sorghi]|uniref:Uncharacterized protein n=1 Tax=Puccinia sorghi TaxID=27349 RepID=A0A0L6UDP1_9BASI|nr:hypothetical protein VP01_76g13 [Puccinia sorghi]
MFELLSLSERLAVVHSILETVLENMEILHVRLILRYFQELDRCILNIQRRLNGLPILGGPFVSPALAELPASLMVPFPHMDLSTALAEGSAPDMINAPLHVCMATLFRNATNVHETLMELGGDFVPGPLKDHLTALEEPVKTSSTVLMGPHCFQSQMVPHRPRNQNPARILENLTTIVAVSLRSTTPNSKMPLCVICLQAYLKSDIVTVLPCHTTHHFHRGRGCIQVRNILA